MKMGPEHEQPGQGWTHGEGTSQPGAAEWALAGRRA